MVTYADKMIGRIDAKLTELGIREDTLVIFLGDNGTSNKIRSQFAGRELQGGKGLPNKRGMHVPLIAHWPKKISAGAVNENLVASTDFLPTICEAAGVELPSSMPDDGRSFYPQLLGQAGVPRETLYCWYARGNALTNVREFAMSKRYKLYRDGSFVDLIADPEEAQPRRVDQLSHAEAQAASQLKAELSRFANARPSEVEAAAAAAANATGKRDRPRKRRGQRQRAAAATLEE